MWLHYKFHQNRVFQGGGQRRYCFFKEAGYNCDVRNRNDFERLLKRSDIEILYDKIGIQFGKDGNEVNGVAEINEGTSIVFHSADPATVSLPGPIVFEETSPKPTPRKKRAGRPKGAKNKKRR